MEWTKEECKTIYDFITLMIRKGWAKSVIIDKENMTVTLKK